MNTSNSNKYKAVRVFYDISQGKKIEVAKVNALYRDKSKQLRLPSHVIAFDSCFEYKVYKELIRIYDTENIYCHHPVEVFPSGICYPLGKIWRVDFCVYPRGLKSIPFYVEAKGMPTDYFLSILATLEITNIEVFSRLYLLFEKKIPNYRVISNLVKAQNSQKIDIVFMPKIMTLKNFVTYKQTIGELIK